jgi:rRNA maturation endonuclease Nob1
VTGAAVNAGTAVSAGVGLGLGLVMVPYMFQAMAPYGRGKPVIVCLSCGGKNPEEFKFCGHCGRSLYPPPRVQCPKCHAGVEDAKFCENCGVRLRTQKK